MLILPTREYDFMYETILTCSSIQYKLCCLSVNTVSANILMTFSEPSVSRKCYRMETNVIILSLSSQNIIFSPINQLLQICLLTCDNGSFWLHGSAGYLRSLTMIRLVQEAHHASNQPMKTFVLVCQPKCCFEGLIAHVYGLIHLQVLIM